MNARIFKVLINFCNTKPFNWLLTQFTQARISKLFIPKYIRMFQINTEEIKQDLEQFKSLNAFFIRELLPNARPIATNPEHIISPVDCKLETSQTITPDAQFTVKGQTLSLAELLGNHTTASRFNDGHIFVLYLSPADYHRIHAPFDSRLLQRYALGKKSWPVNDNGLKYGPRPLCTNYRIINLLANDAAAIFVGATNVNSIVCNTEEDWQKGKEVAYFQFGSTVILLFTKAQITSLKQAGDRLKMGEALAKFN